MEINMANYFDIHDELLHQRDKLINDLKQYEQLIDDHKHQLHIINIKIQSLETNMFLTSFREIFPDIQSGDILGTPDNDCLIIFLGYDDDSDVIFSWYHTDKRNVILTGPLDIIKYITKKYYRCFDIKTRQLRFQSIDNFLLSGTPLKQFVLIDRNLVKSIK